MFFTWLKDRARNAVLAGIAEAAEQVNGTPDTPDALDRLRRLALPAPAEPEAAPEATGRKRGKEAS